MDSDEEAALAAIIIATFTEYIKHKKGGIEGNGLNVGFKGKITLHLEFSRKHSRDILLPDTLLSVLQFFLVLFDFAVVTLPNLNFFLYSIFPEIYYTFCFENILHIHFQFLIGQNTCSIIFREKITFD